MELEDKVKAVEQVFHQLDEEITKLQQWSTLHCKSGCGKCCFKADIEATILEFLPFAFHLQKEDRAEEWYERLKQSDSSICLILNPTQMGAGLCSQYQHRGLICRLFGYSARTNKYEKREGAAVPVMSDYYMQLHAIDFELTKDFYPINQAIRKAIEVVLQYFAYR